MFRRIFHTALLSGLIAGLFASAVQIVRVVPLIYRAEVYERAAEQPAPPAGAHDQNAAGHEHATVEWQPEDGFERIAFTVLTDVIAAIGFAMVLVGAFVLSGREIDAGRGLLWGLAGYAVFSLAPSLGLAPELPGAAPEEVASADLFARQVWWIATAAATMAGLAAMVFSPRWVGKLLGAALLFLPHFIGAPHRAGIESVVPVELRSEFVVATLVTSGLFWLVLGGLSGWLYRRLPTQL